MGLMQFLVPDRRWLPDGAATGVYMTGLDGTPMGGSAATDPAGLIVQRTGDESGNLHVPWRVVGRGQWTLSTATLMTRAKPYVLPVELARGTMQRLRNQIAAWTNSGVEIPSAVAKQVRRSAGLFSRAATLQHKPDEAAALAQQSIAESLGAIEGLAESFIEQVLVMRHEQTEKLPTLLAAGLGRGDAVDQAADAIESAFNTVAAPLPWSQIEFDEGRRDWTAADERIEQCRQRSWRVAAGPLIQADMSGLPHWVFLWETNFNRILRSIEQHVEETVSRYKGKVHLWLATSRTNTCDVLPLDDQQRLEMTLRAVETVRRIDPQTPIVATLAQPWGEHMIEHPKELSPMHFADALLRAEGGVSGIGLEWALGYHPRGSMARDLLAVNLHVDRWSQFGLPLAISLVVPSAGGDDLRATVLGAKTEGGPNGERTDQWQSDWAAHLVRLLLAKPSVQAVVWSQWSDATPHDFPHGGLYDAKGNEKPILDSLRSIREQHLA